MNKTNINLKKNLIQLLHINNCINLNINKEKCKKKLKKR